MQALIPSGEPSQLPGLRNDTGRPRNGATGIGFGVLPANGTPGQGQYRLNGRAHRGSIVTLRIRAGGRRRRRRAADGSSLPADAGDVPGGGG
jgi:hypothetical protein